MKMHSALVLAAGLAVVLPATNLLAGDITGTVTLNGAPPAEVPLPQVLGDTFCGKLYQSAPTTHHFIVGPNKELANVVVMLKGISGKSTGASAPPVELDQKECMYGPQIMVIQTNQKLLVKNSDATLHNVHLSPTVSANADANAGKLNMPQGAGAPVLTLAFPAPENFLKFQCDVHNWMFAWVTVVDHPYYAVTGKDGTFKIGNVPPGKYTITAMHRKAGPKEGTDKEVEVKDGVTKVDFALDVK